MDRFRSAMDYAERWLDIIGREELDQSTAQEISKETVENFVNQKRGFSI